MSVKTKRRREIANNVIILFIIINFSNTIN